MGKYDNNPNLIDQIKNSSYEDLNNLSDKLRTDLINTVSKNGGHLASNLGAVELTVALHKVFDTPNDKIIWDVGHQTYIHKMITGRYDAMNTIRQIDGISGFPKRSESKHDMFDSGHSGTSISACLGFAKARDIKQEKYSCIAVIGDGAMTGGVAWEALSSAGSSKTPIIVILNDNKMSISANVGGFAKHLQKLRISKAYNKFKLGIKRSSSNKTVSKLEKIRNSFKYYLVPGVIFEELGFKYYGPIDGHNIEQLCNAFNFAKDLDRPVLLHVITKKGKGFAPAEHNPSKFHGIGSFNPDTVSEISDTNEKSWSYIFGDELIKLASANDKIVAVTAAMADGTGLGDFKKTYNNRFFDVGIAEQNAVSFCAGLALNGLKPVFAVYSTFLQRAYDQLVTEICLQNLPVIFAIDRAGITGGDGETHQGEFDIAFLRSIPNLTILSPRDELSLRKMLDYAFTLNGPVAIRYPRGNAAEYPIELPKLSLYNFEPQIVAEGKDLLIISDGIMLNECILASEVLKQKGISAAVCDLRTLKPLPDIKDILSQYEYIVTVEDGCKLGGIGEEISSYAMENLLSCKILNLGWPDKFIEHGKVDQLRARYGLDKNGIAIKCGEYFEKETGRTSN